MWEAGRAMTTSFRERNPFLVGFVSIVLLAAGVFGAFSINRFDGLKGVYRLAADVRDAAGLRSGNEVRVAGVKVGQVTGVSLRPGSARISMEIADDVALPENTRMAVKLKTLLGQKFVDLQLPPSFVNGPHDTSEAPGDEGFLAAGDVIPIDRTSIPFEIYQAANEGTAVLEQIDKASLRRMLRVLGGTVGASRGELRRALSSLARTGEILADKSFSIRRVLDSSEEATRALATADTDIEGVLGRSAEVLEVLADRRSDVSSLLAATRDLADNLGLLIQVSRGTVEAGSADLDRILVTVEGELETIDAALGELGTAQEMFAQPLSFGRFTEGHVCAVTSEDTCVPHGSPEDPGLPIHGVQPSPSPRVGGAR